MDALLGFVKDLLSSQPVLQAFAGGVALIVVSWMVMRGRQDREVSGTHVPVAPGTVSDPPAIFTQGPVEMWNALRDAREFIREIRDFARRRTSDLEDLVDAVKDVREAAKTQSECVREIRENSRRQVELMTRQLEVLDRIEREQSTMNRARARKPDVE